MKLLVRAGLVRGERRGRWVYYTLDPAGFALGRAFADRFLALSPTFPEPQVA